MRRIGVRLLSITVSMLVMASACTNDDDRAEPDDSSPSQVSPETGLIEITLSQGQNPAAGEAALQVVDGLELTEGEVAGILDRLPRWDVPADDVEEFNRPTETLGQRPRRVRQDRHYFSNAAKARCQCFDIDGML